ncbi:HlyD family secretion protein [Thermosulfuriphilus sp.]
MIHAKRLKDGRRLALIFLLAALVVVFVWAVLLIRHRLNYAISNAVFVETEGLINLGFDRVSGRIVKLNKNEGDWVKAGEVLAEIEARDYRLQTERILAELKALKEEEARREISLRRLDQEVRLKKAIAQDKARGLKEELSSLEAKIKGISSTIDQLRRDRDRFSSLYQAQVVSKRRLEAIETKLAEKEAEKEALLAQKRSLYAALSAARKEIRLAEAQELRIKEGQRDLASLKERIVATEARLAEVRRLVAYCQLKSPISGRIAKKYRSLGDVVRPGAPVYALVDPSDIYILVLLEENKLRGVKEGCPAKITIDAYPGEIFRGIVSEILPTSAAKFALVPRDISAGEFTKVAQRIPIKIKITEGPVELLKIGLGGEVEIRRQP